MATRSGSEALQMSQHLWSDVLSADTSFQRSLAQNMASKGYLVLKADKSVAKVMEKLRKQSTKFFTKSTLAEKKDVCCEYIGEKPQSARDRLEVRVLRGDQKTAFVALKRDQFAGGYDSQISSTRASEILHTYFGECLLTMHGMMEEMANQLLAILCAFLSYPAHEALKTHLYQEKETPGVLRLMRYAERPPLETSTSGIPELAIDHTDIGLITLMPYSSSGTLQILSSEFDWLNVEHGQSPDTIVAIVGEQLAYLSNWTFQAVRHRVIPGPPSVQRFSFPFLMRAPAEFEVLQAETGKRRLAKHILNHIFELPTRLQLLAKLSLEFTEAYGAACTGSKRNTIPMATCVANPGRNAQSSGIWPILLFFSGGLPSSRTNRRLRSSWKHGDLSMAQKGSENGDTNERSAIRENQGWDVKSWPHTLETCFIDTKYHGEAFQVIFYLVSWRDHVESTENWFEDLSWRVRSSLIVFGRAHLEGMFDLNAHRME